MDGKGPFGQGTCFFQSDSSCIHLAPHWQSIAKVERVVVAPPKAPQNAGLLAMTTGTRTRFSQDNLPPAIKILWKSVFIPTFRAHIASLGSANPFSLSDPVDLVQLVAKKVYADQYYSNLKRSKSLFPKGVVYELVSHMVSICFSGLRNIPIHLPCSQAIAITHTWRTGIKSAANKALEAKFSEGEMFDPRATVDDSDEHEDC